MNRLERAQLRQLRIGLLTEARIYGSGKDWLAEITQRQGERARFEVEHPDGEGSTQPEARP